MGLDISGMYSEKHYRFSYTGLHLVRFLGAIACDFKGSYTDFCHLEDNNETWKRFPKLWQLMHFSDCEGILISKWFLRNIDYKNSFNLGNLNKLCKELNFIKDQLARFPEKFENVKKETWALKPFWKLFDLVKEEKEENGVLQFH